MTHPLDLSLELSKHGDFDAAEAILDTLPEDPRALFNKGWHYLRHGNLKRGMEGLSVGRWLNVFGSPPLKTDRPIWNGEPLKGKKLLLRGEGGYGDEIINVRFALDFKMLGADVTVSCSRSLMPLFRTLSYIDALIDSDHASAADFDYWVPAMSAAQTLGLDYDDLDDLPYIPVPEPLNLPGDKFRVGLKLSGNPEFEHHQWRQFPKELMLGLTDLNADFYSLDMDFVPVLINVEMGHWLQTAKLLSALDLVITSCTAIAHLAGAMGIPVWVIVPILPYYVHAMPGITSPWYASMRLYRQEAFGEWEAPFVNIRKDLAERLKE